jgi:hypothetical protein
MQARLTTKPQHEVIAGIQALDLESVKLRMMDAELGEGWTRQYADSIAVAYKTYLTMLVKHPDDAEDILLSEDVDEFWHTHILQTRKYMQDCQNVFGNYLHHEPHVGEVTPADLEKRTVQAEKTRQLYEREFGGTRQSEMAWAGEAIQVKRAAYSSASIRADSAAYSSASILPGSAAYSSASIRAGSAAYSSASIRSGNAAYSSASIQSGNAAYSSASIRQEKAAYSSASIRAESAAYSSASIRPGNAAYSSASIHQAKAAYSSASIRAQSAAYSSASIRPENAAYSSASIHQAKAAYSSASIQGSHAAYSSASIENRAPRPAETATSIAA